jgi:dipeptidyl-peptidase-4
VPEKIINFVKNQRIMKKYTSLLVFFFFVTSIFAQEQKELTLEDAVFGYYKGLYPENLSQLQWSKNSNEFLYKKGDSLIITDAATLTKHAVKKEEIARVVDGVKRLPYIQIFTSDYLIFQKDSTFVFYNYKQKSAEFIKTAAAAENTDIDWKNFRIAYTIDNDLYIADKNHHKIPVAVNDNPDIVSGQAIARFEFGISKGTFWSPDGRYLAFYQKDETDVENYPLVDITQTPAALKNIKYPMNGRGSEKPAVGIYDTQTGKTVFLDLFDKAGEYHYATNLTWDTNSRYIYLAEVNREQNRMWFNKYKVPDGGFVKTLFEEKNERWVEPEKPAYFVPGTRQFVWMSERDGFMNLYLYDADNGRLIRQLTRNAWVMTGVSGFSQDGAYVYATGTGKDPRQNHLFRIKLKSGYQKQLTQDKGTHRVQLSFDGNYFLDDYSSVDVPRIICLKKTGSKKSIAKLLEAEDPLKAYGLSKPELISIKGAFTDVLYGRIIKPSDFDPSKKYPVLIYVYGGPHVQLVTDTWMAGASLWMYWLAEQGYIVFTLDNHGSMNRGFAFESVIHRQLGQVEAKDQMFGVAYLRTLPYVDANRIAVHGWSYGGYMTLTLLTEYPEVFKVGVAGGPVTDWKWYEVMYGERYMDTYKENPEGFKQTSILNKIENLQAKLLTVHGYMDDVVVPQHNIALHLKAIEKQIQMDFYLYPTDKHGVGGKRRLHLYRKMLNYIMENNK